jgi:hypothetical protein
MSIFHTNTLVQSIDPEILQSIYRRKHKNRANLKTQLFSELTEYKQEWFSNLLRNKDLIRENESLLIISAVSDNEWIALSNMSIYYIDNGFKKIDYVDISECSVNTGEIWDQGFIGFLENKGLKIITKDNQEILLSVADNGNVNQTLADLISWSVNQLTLSTK